jgi:hypothetical protein
VPKTHLWLIRYKYLFRLARHLFRQGYTILLFECAKVASHPRIGGPGGYIAMHLFSKLVLDDLDYFTAKMNCFYNKKWPQRNFLSQQQRISVIRLRWMLKFFS